jgi:MbtH protein
MQSEEYVVVMNDEEQYSIWMADRDVPAGWTVQPMKGGKEDCLEYIRTHWTDMRPASLKRRTAS